MRRIASTLITGVALWAAACNCGEGSGEPSDGTETDTNSEGGTSQPSTTTRGAVEDSSDSTNPGTDESETTDSPPGPNGAVCEDGTDCMSGVCIAPFDGRRGDFACVADCIGVMDEDNWCSDASACCDANAICTMRGYCTVE